ncbi:MAG TPA: 3-isopropylmalate dehydratase small subunit [Hyphomicrobiaceae bacterium]|nr:3-isopropylmalate dehydratase small subunit [Hyphomicrobiaceae bacterium]
MKPLTHLSAVAMPLDQPNIDTDQIIPARFLGRERDEQVEGLFRDLRFTPEGKPRPEFVLNDPAYREAQIIVADRNFACGSSRENAVTALLDNGFKVFIAPSFGDIFANNCFQNGCLAIVLPEERCRKMREHLRRNPGARITVDIEAQTVTGPDNEFARFEIDSFRKDGLMKGLDDISLTLAYGDDIARFEARQKCDAGWL